MRSVYTEDVVRLLEQFQPLSILLLDSEGEQPFLAYRDTQPRCQLERLSGTDIMNQLQTRGRYSFGFVANTLERLDKTVAVQILARLRDVHTERLFIVVPVGAEWEGLASTWETSDLIGYGMRLVQTYQHDGRRLQMYKFDIANYKDTPEWLNPKHWAHPERWDKYRW